MTIEKSEAVSTVTKDDEKHQIKDLEIGKDAESIEVGSSDEAGSSEWPLVEERGHYATNPCRHQGTRESSINM